MEDKQEQKEQDKPVDVSLVEPVVGEKIERETTKKCCELTQDVKKGCHYCLRCWSLSLNGVEGCCSILSACCIGFSNIAIGCNKCLEQMDCDGH